MNGNRSAEQLLGEAVQHVRLVTQEARKVASTALEFHQTLLRVNTALEAVQGEQREFRSEMNDAIAELTRWVARIERTRQQSIPSITDDDWAETPTGSIHLNMTRDTFEEKFSSFMREREQKQDAQKWRALWKKSKTGVYVVATGALTLSGERFMQWVWSVLSHLRLH